MGSLQKIVIFTSSSGTAPVWRSDIKLKKNQIFLEFLTNSWLLRLADEVAHVPHLRQLQAHLRSETDGEVVLIEKGGATGTQPKGQDDHAWRYYARAINPDFVPGYFIDVLPDHQDLENGIVGPGTIKKVPCYALADVIWRVVGIVDEEDEDPPSWTLADDPLGATCIANTRLFFDQLVEFFAWKGLYDLEGSETVVMLVQLPKCLAAVVANGIPVDLNQISTTA